MTPESIRRFNIALPQGNLSAYSNRHIDGQPQILALHGWLDNAASFFPLIQESPEFNWTAIDLPGHGFSFHRPEHTFYHFVDWISDLVSLMTARYQAPVTIVGHSLGGMLGTVVSGLYPELIDKLVLIDAAGLVTQDEQDGAEQLRQALDSRHVNTGNLKTFTLSSAIKARMKSGNISQNAAELLVKHSVKSVDGGWQWSSDKRLKSRSPLRLTDHQARQIINNINAPTLLCLAENGYQSIRENYAKFQQDYKNLRKVDVPGNHHCHMDNVEQIAFAIRQFITKV